MAFGIPAFGHRDGVYSVPISSAAYIGSTKRFFFCLERREHSSGFVRKVEKAETQIWVPKKFPEQKKNDKKKEAKKKKKAVGILSFNAFSKSPR